MKNTTVIVGPPGTGKTTTLLNLVDQYLAKGIQPNKIGFVSFTKKSVEEAKTRAFKRFNMDSEEFVYFRTLHSLAFYQLSMNKNDVMERQHYKELGDLLGITIKGRSAADYAVEELEKGDQLVFVESLARLRNESLRDTYDKDYYDFSYAELERFAGALNKFKSVNMISDFTDMLTQFYFQGQKPKLSVLFVDEAQDLCKLQWMIIEQLAESSDITYIAGDDDQAIFRWSGADIEYFINLAKENAVKVLDQSYRIPVTIHKFSQDLIGGIKDRVPKIYKPTDKSGLFNYVSSIEDLDMSEGEWLILVRNIFAINNVIEQLRYLGFAYSSRFKSSKDLESLQAALTWNQLLLGKRVKVAAIKNMLTHMSNMRYGKPFKGYRDTDVIDMKILKDVCNVYDTTKRWDEALDKLPEDDVMYFMAARKKGESFIKGARIHVSTIHGAKGGEAQNVVLFTDISNKTYSAMQNNYEDEIRVFYVGITRAKENLYIVTPQTNYYFDL